MPVFQPEPGISVVSPAGRLDASVAAGFENTLLSQLDQPGDVLIVDMSLVTYISSRGLKALVAAWRSAREIGGELAIVSVAAPVASVLETVGFTQIFSMYGSTEEALANLRARQV
jgi:anti-sigma B factor antagonist